MFVHRNIANCVVHTDLNCLSVIHYAVSVLKVKHIIVTGHYGCGGVAAALTNQQFGLVDHWIRNIRDVYQKQKAELENITDEKERLNLLCELNVKQQALNVTALPAVQNAWKEGRELTVHGWIYSLEDGLLKKLTDSIGSIEQVAEQFRVI